VENDFIHIGKPQFLHHAILSNPRSRRSILTCAEAANQTQSRM